MRYEIDHKKKIVIFYIKDQSHELSFDDFGIFFGTLILKMGKKFDLLKAFEAYTSVVEEISEYFKKHKVLTFKEFEKIYRKHRPNVLKGP